MSAFGKFVPLGVNRPWNWMNGARFQPHYASSYFQDKGFLEVSYPYPPCAEMSAQNSPQGKPGY